MHILRSKKLHHAIAFGIGAAVGVLYLMSAIAANADTVAGVSITAAGKTVVRGARVTKVTHTEIFAVSEWGTARIQWKIDTNGSTRYMPDSEDRTLPQLVRVGERIGFTGTMDQNSGVPIIHASMIRNETVVQSSTVLSGSVIERDSSGILMLTDTGTSTIRIGTGTIMTKDGNKMHAEDVTPGETIKAFGTFNARIRVLDADRIVSESLPEIPNTGAPQKTGIFQTIVSWLRLGGSALSLR